jgi:hypothetical protein
MASLNQKNQVDKQKIVSKIKFKTILKEKGFESYLEFLNSDLWKQLKSKMLNANIPYSCVCCGSKNLLQLHHRRYKKNDLLKLKITNLCWVCRSCHQEIHKLSELEHIHISHATRRIYKKYHRQVI